MSPVIDAWRARGDYVDAIEGRVWAIMAQQPGGNGTPVLALHGFPTSSFDFERVIERIVPRRRVVAFDFLGFGLSDKPPASALSLFDQADATIAVARAFGLTSVHLFAHDMGTSVVTELLARRERGLLPFEIASFVLMNGSVHTELAHLTLGQRLLKSPLGPLVARLNSKRTFKAQMRRLFARPPGDADLDAMWELCAREDGAARIPTIVRYIEDRARFRGRWIGALERCRVPALVAWGRRDPVAVMAIAELLAAEIPGARLETWDELAHYPHVEDPARVAATVTAFWDAL